MMELDVRFLHLGRYPGVVVAASLAGGTGFNDFGKVSIHAKNMGTLQGLFETARGLELIRFQQQALWW